ncbi:MAG: hypothetical protein EA397_10555 [Deltaproteobacteria bacterium]|nr:MAG: hypothetical protein EA397_10555 [Deltaproteobacteria bacterium]
MPRRVPYVPPPELRSPRGPKRDAKGGPRAPKRPPKKHRSDPKVRARAEELAESGMPFQLAMAVALGRVSLNDALERLARQERVQKIIDEHDLSRALATQVAIGHASLDAVLARRRMQEHRELNRLRSCLDEALGLELPLVFGLHGRRQVQAHVQAVEPYTATLLIEGAEDPEEVHKLQFKYAYKPESAKKARRLMSHHPELSAEPVAPIRRPQDRYTCSDKRLFRYMDGEQSIRVTLLEGEVFVGVVTWFGRYEFGLRCKDVDMTVFRHSLHEITED